MPEIILEKIKLDDAYALLELNSLIGLIRPEKNPNELPKVIAVDTRGEVHLGELEKAIQLIQPYEHQPCSHSDAYMKFECGRDLVVRVKGLQYEGCCGMLLDGDISQLYLIK